MKKSSLKVRLESVQHLGDFVCLDIGAENVLMTAEQALQVVDALLDMTERIESRRAVNKPILRLVGGRHVH